MAQQWILIDSPQSHVAETPRAWTGEHHGTPLSWQLGTLSGGRSEGVQILRVQSGATEFILVPTRGLGLWQASRDGQPFGWSSPVAGPVHPHWVPIADPSGLGWLEGFDELLVRCGLASNGAPDFDSAGRLTCPLHGRIANSPAHHLSIAVDDQGTLTVTGEVRETRFLIRSLRLRSTLRLRLDADVLELTDEIINDSAQDTTAQMLYHLNLGRPILGPGAELLAPVKELAPRDPRAAEGLARWAQFEGPQAGFAEQVYFMRLHCDDSGTSRAMLRAADRQLGCGVTFDHQALPYFVLWKNTAAEADGYVTGLEPSTNLPNPHSFESRHGRVLPLAAGATARLSLQIHLLVGAAAVDRFATEIASMEREQATSLVHRAPPANWSA
jgi:galactose mutarotase-like enzyme